MTHHCNMLRQYRHVSENWIRTCAQGKSIRVWNMIMTTTSIWKAFQENNSTCKWLTTMSSEMDSLSPTYFSMYMARATPSMGCPIQRGSILASREESTSWLTVVTSPIYRTRSYAEWSGLNFEHGNAWLSGISCGCTWSHCHCSQLETLYPNPGLVFSSPLSCTNLHQPCFQYHHLPVCFASTTHFHHLRPFSTP